MAVRSALRIERRLVPNVDSAIKHKLAGIRRINLENGPTAGRLFDRASWRGSSALDSTRIYRYDSSKTAFLCHPRRAASPASIAGATWSHRDPSAQRRPGREAPPHTPSSYRAAFLSTLGPESSTLSSQRHRDKGVRGALDEDHRLIAAYETLRGAIIYLGPRSRVRSHFPSVASLIRHYTAGRSRSAPLISAWAWTVAACTIRYDAGVKRQAREIQYTVRGIPQEVDRALRRKAAQRRLSLNQIIVEELTAGTMGIRKRADFHDVVGHWTPDSAFDEIMATQRQIDPDKWK